MIFYGFGFLNFLVVCVTLVDGLYFPTGVVNVSLPNWRKLPKPLPPVMRLEAVAGAGERDGEGEEEDAGIQYAVASETTSGLFRVEGNELRLNEEFFSSGDIISKHQSVIVSGRSGAEEMGNSTINLLLTGDKINCERWKRNLCFWAGASYRVFENRRPTLLGQLSSQFYVSLCKSFNLSYEIFKGGEYVEVKRKEKTKEWSLSTKKKIGGEKPQIRFGLNCTVSTSAGEDTFQREFDLHVLRDENLQIFFDLTYNVPGSDVIYENQKVATGIISNPGGGSKLDKLKVTLGNDTNGYFDLKCVRKSVESSPKTSYYNCEVSAKQTIHLTGPYAAYVQIEDTSLPLGNPNRFRFQNISLEPSVSGLEKESLMLSTNPEESFMLDLKYPDSAIVSRRAVIGTRIAEPTLSRTPPNTEIRKQVVQSKIKFQVISPGPFNVTHLGGIVFVANRHLLKETVYRTKITGVYPNGYRFFSTLLVNVTDPRVFGEDVCDKTVDENTRVSCSEKRFKLECERTCGVSSGLLGRTKEGRPVTSRCVWRSNEKPEKLSRRYQTCSPDLSTCPDRYCDPLEAFFPKACPQDCTEYVFGSANKENHVPGIASATGVCTCDNRQKCLCSLVTENLKQERKKTKQIINDTAAPLQREVISAIKASYTDQCGTICLLSIVIGTVIFVFGTSAILLMVYRRRLKKRCPNQRPLKEDMVNINYEEYVERPGDILRPLAQSGAVKEIPEYYDKKWEFPRHRLTIEETLGEGEFGKVLKARADGIAGNDGPITVAVKTLKDNAKESELADLISEYQLLKEIDHPNVIHLLGACTKLDGPVYVIIEYAEHGSLRNYLRKHRHISSEHLTGKENETSYVQTITPKDILTFAWQIAKGMNYLTEMKLVHRDLAARNVLVAEGLICKISDFGLTRDIYEDDTYLKRSEGRVPVKWMALESLADHIYTTKSDVWSYGVVLWELVTTGASPYPGIAGQNLFHLLKSGFRMEKPPNCSSELYQILRSCWQENPSHRPTFKSLVAKFEEMLGEGKDYLDLNPRTAENKTYFGEFLTDEDERETFLPPGKDNGVFKLRFEMFENSEKPRECSKCRMVKCVCGVLRYENEVPKPKYENDGMEDTGYVQPTGHPKPVNSTCELTNNTNVDSKKDIFDVKKI